MNKPLISLIIPMYNAEKYIKELIISIKNQTYNYFDAVLINDGSSDLTEEICIKTIGKDKRFRLFNKTNGGVSTARNFGLKKIDGDYVCFIDADDILNENYLLDFAKIINNSDNNSLYCCSYFSFKDIVEQRKDTDENVEIIENELKYDILYNNKFRGYLWNKCFCVKHIIKNKLFFNEKVYMTEDLLFIIHYLERVNRVYCINKQNYYYRITSNSASKRKNNVKWFSIFITQDYILSIIDKFNEETSQKAVYNYLYYLYYAKFRLKEVKDPDEFNIIFNDIENRIRKSKELFKKLNRKNIFKIYIYRFFGFLIFK